VNGTGEIVSVSALVALIQELVEDNFVEVLVRGEISNLSRPASGHSYFTLKDRRAQLRCAMFRSSARAVKFSPENGMEVICHGRISLYPQRGDLQLIIDGMEPEGVGGLQLAFEQLKEKLQREGLFDDVHKRSLPEFPQTIGVVTSPTGAAVRDILNILRRRSTGLRVLLRPSLVQGAGAASEIARAIAELNQEASADVLIVGRGGGSLEDLWAFNEELVARAIAGSKIPVISAVGHETDISIADFVADLRAPTPSAAAELVVKNRLELELHLDQLSLRLGSLMQARLRLVRDRLYHLEKRLRSPQEMLRLQRIQLDKATDALRHAKNLYMEKRRSSLQSLVGQLDMLSPLSVLARGYAVVRDLQTDTVVRDVVRVDVGDALQLSLAKGTLIAEVIEVRQETAAKQSRS
jgi:exodeoxyribonuclease VII large subunit